MAEERTIDRTGWPSGPWDREPDRVEFTHAGLPCLMLRNDRGVWCGYAAVPPGHPLHGVDYNEDAASHLEAHGGLSYCGRCSGEICHVPQPGEPDDVWWFGFDCQHAWDYAPGMEARERVLGIPPATSSFYRMMKYRDADYVKKAVRHLANQLAECR